jgi:hypothetical protein
MQCLLNTITVRMCSTQCRHHHHSCITSPLFLAPPTKFNHCSKFKQYLATSGKLLSDSLTSFEIFIDGIKEALDTAMSVHYSFTPHAEWSESYLLTTFLCPPEMTHHPRYTTMRVTYNMYGQMLYRHLHSATIIDFSLCPNAYHELAALDSIKCGGQLLQEWVWSCSPHMNGLFRDFRHEIRQVLPVANELSFLFYHRTQDLAREIVLSLDATGMQHGLLHHFIQAL